MLMLASGCGMRTRVITPDSEEYESIPLFAQCLIEAYPNEIVGYGDNHLVWNDGTTLLYDDGLDKSVQEMLEEGDNEDMSYWLYTNVIEPFNDAGRIRNDLLFKKMYGETEYNMEKNLTTIVWCPTLVNMRVRVTTVNGVDKQLQKVSDELDTHPEWKKYLDGISTINWRVVAGTNRMSAHAFGIAIDIGVSESNYWRLDYPEADENDTIAYRNTFPLELVEVFERHGFIWGGRWYHYDTMHFEYRPEIMLYRQKMAKE